MSRTGTRRPNGSGSIRSDGYVQIKAPGHPMTGARGLGFLHRIRLFDKIGYGPHYCSYCPKIIHWRVDLECDHQDHDRSNNDPANLVPCCIECNRARWNRGKTGCPKSNEHGPYDKLLPGGHRYCSKCKAEKEARRRKRLKEGIFIEAE